MVISFPIHLLLNYGNQEKYSTSHTPHQHTTDHHRYNFSFFFLVDFFLWENKFDLLITLLVLV